VAYHEGYIYALTGYPFCPSLQVFKMAVGGGPWIGPVTIPDPGGFFPGTTADGFTILVNNGVVTFLINNGDESCTYREYDSTSGLPTGNGFFVPGFAICTGVDTSDSDTDGTHVLYFSVFDTSGAAAVNAIHSATLTVTPSFSLSPGVTVAPADGWSLVEDISLVHGFAGTPGAANCHGKTVSDLAHTYGGMANAASALGFASVADLQAAIDAFCN
jgi:hypothetical protein